MYQPSLRDQILQAISVLGDLFDPEFSERAMTICAFNHEIHAAAFLGLCAKEWPALALAEFQPDFSKQDVLNALIPAIQIERQLPTFTHVEDEEPSSNCTGFGNTPAELLPARLN